MRRHESVCNQLLPISAGDSQRKIPVTQSQAARLCETCARESSVLVGGCFVLEHYASQRQ